MKKRTPIGRKFDTQLLKDEPATARTHTYTLASGEKATFTLSRVDHDKLDANTFVDSQTNGRDQQALTEDSVADISRTLVLQQFFPAIGRKGDDGRVEILDGSRRRAAALFSGTGLDILVTEQPLSQSDARQLAADIQTAREHNLREVGQRLLLLKQQGMSQKAIAASEKLSPAKVTRAIQAASVPADMLSVFPVQSELSYPDYKLLLALSESFAEAGRDLVDLIAAVMVEQETLSRDVAADAYKESLMRAYRQQATALMAKPQKAKVTTQPLWRFDDKDTYARRKQKDRTVSFEFSRLPKSVIKDLDAAVEAVLKKHLAS
ncbi:ParB family protein [Veronia pacifica]|uniref:Chromosome partitioning protein ParB n=1 Tax=Veronia pacifica TaxID=1080227 RepID=A0A1C3EBT0_9GAMM|nr:ParB family protein [Veronia pacifica]ODA30644.1 chromosome partitioning protein ParB [Veronia pacifica]